MDASEKREGFSQGKDLKTDLLPDRSLWFGLCNKFIVYWMQIREELPCL